MGTDGLNRMVFEPWPYQHYAIERIEQNPFCGLFLDMGLGKTVCALTAIDHLVYEQMEINRVLVIAPKRVAEDTWSTEAGKWAHLSHLRLSVVLGSEKERIAALDRKADIYVINRENVVWLVDYYRRALPFDMIVIDELSSFKSHAAKRFKALRLARAGVSRIVGLTGTPTSNGLMDLWAQVFLLDGGARLGRTLTAYRNNYFRPGKRNGAIVYNWEPLPGAKDRIFEKISDLCISMKSEDYIQMPDKVEKIIRVRMDSSVRKRYEAFERDQIMAVDPGAVEAVNAAALVGKLLQFSQGAVYDESRTVHHLHDAKLEALDEVIEAADSPILLFYAYQHDRDRLMKRYPQARELYGSDEIAAWNRGEIPLLIAHPASAGHGLNLQYGGHNVVWFGLTWSLELFEQANARLFRQGQGHPVVITYILTADTWDENVLTALKGKKKTTDELMAAIKARVSFYHNNSNNLEG